MITKEKIADHIIKSSQGGEIVSYRKIDPREVYESIERARNGVMQAIIDGGNNLDGEFITQYKNVPILNDGDINLKYSTLPTRLISFSGHDGLQQVSPMKNQGESFIKVSSGSQAIYGSLEAAKIGGKTGYYLQRERVGTDQSIRIYYINCPFQYDKVLIKMVASTYDFDEDEALPIPAQYENQLVAMVFQDMGLQLSTPLDVKNNMEPNDQNT